MRPPSCIPESCRHFHGFATTKLYPRILPSFPRFCDHRVVSLFSRSSCIVIFTMLRPPTRNVIFTVWRPPSCTVVITDWQSPSRIVIFTKPINRCCDHRHRLVTLFSRFGDHRVAPLLSRPGNFNPRVVSLILRFCDHRVAPVVLTVVITAWRPPPRVVSLLLRLGDSRVVRMWCSQ